MIPNLAELNRALLIADSLGHDATGILRSTIIAHCKSHVIEGRMPDHEDTIVFSIQIGLFKAKGQRRILLTDEGKIFLQFNPDKIYDLSSEQKQYLIRRLFMDGVFQKELKECLRCFSISDIKDTLTWSSVDSTPFRHSWLVAHMEQLGLVEKAATGYNVNKEYAQTVVTFINEPKGYTEEQLFEWLAEKKNLGNIAEKLVLDFERSRLKDLGYEIESKCVKLVGKINTSAGYDIESFNGRSKGMQFDRYIEVKGSGDPKLRFVWSPNEIKVAEKLADKYWIYYQGGIDKKTGRSRYKPIMIQDPFHTMEKDIRLTRTPNGFVVIGAVSGEKI